MLVSVNLTSNANRTTKDNSVPILGIAETIDELVQQCLYHDHSISNPLERGRITPDRNFVLLIKFFSKTPTTNQYSNPLQPIPNLYLLAT